MVSFTRVSNKISGKEVNSKEKIRAAILHRFYVSQKIYQHRNNVETKADQNYQGHWCVVSSPLGTASVCYLIISDMFFKFFIWYH